MDSVPTIAIVGRPNVGKSTLFNRLIGKRLAITSKEAGTTRDRLFEQWEGSGYQSNLVDTGGLEYGQKENIEEDVQSQAKVAIKEADVILFVVDIIEGLTTNDFSAAEILRKTQKPVILIANKCDHPKNIEENIYNIYELGFDEPIQVSAIHNLGIEQIESEIEKTLKKLKFKKSKIEKKEDENINIAIIGRPNAGKSSLINAILGAEKTIVSDIPGTTRDTTDTHFRYKEQDFNLIDTAGLRRPGKIQKGIEKFSSLRVIMAIERADIVVILIDGEQGPSHQDCHIAKLALDKSKGLILSINKIDLFENNEDERNRVLRVLQKKFSFTPWAPVLFLSAKNRKNTYKILELSEEIMKERKKRIQTSELNTYLQKVTFKHLPASVKVRKPKFFYATQADINPPTFTLFFKNPKDLHFTYPRYLENEIRKEYGFTGTAIKLRLKNKNKDEGKK
jgi:GTPase